MTVKAWLHNNGSAAVTVPNPFDNRNWQPVFQVKGPSYPRGFAFTLRTIATDDKRLEPTGLQPAMVTIQAGQTISSDLPFHSYLKLSEPGEYEITARYHWGGGDATAPSARFRIRPLSIVAASLAADIGGGGGTPFSALVLQDGGGSKTLYEEFFVEDRPDLGEIFTDSLLPQREIGPAAARVYSPWANFDRSGVPYNWQVWTEGGRLFAEAVLAAEPQSYDIGDAAVLRPPLMGTKGDLEVFALANGGSELQWIHFSAPDMHGVESRPPLLEWRAPLTPAAQSGRCTLAPPNSGGSWHVVLAAQSGSSVSLHYVNSAMASGKGAPVTLEIPQAHLLPANEPAVQAIDASDVEVAVLVQRDRDLAIARVKIDATALIAGEVRVTTLGQAPGTVRAAATVFSLDPRRARQLSWMVLMRDGRALTSSSPKKPYALERPVMVPLELLPVSAYTYLLTIARDGLPELMPMR
jgi:hypothetical protein